MEFKSIIAKANGNGELEFVANKHKRPIREVGEFTIEFLNRLGQWEQSAQVFQAASKHEENKIKQAVIDSPEWKEDLPMNYKLGIDVTNFVSIENVLSHIDPIGVSFAFYKSPSKEEAVKPAGEAQETKHPLRDGLAELKDGYPWDEIWRQANDIGIIEFIRRMELRFKITRLPKA